MRVQANPIEPEKYNAMGINAPSPLAGEGIATGQCEDDRVRGIGLRIAMLRQPLTRLRFAKAPSHTGGEGKKRTPQVSQSA